jgi:hypothetical protein
MTLVCILTMLVRILMFYYHLVCILIAYKQKV